MARVTGYKRILRKAVSVALALLFVLGAIPPIALDVAAADQTFTSADGAVYLDSSYSGKSVVIQNGVFSVTVNGATDVTIIFEDVVINRRSVAGNLDTAIGTIVPNLYDVGVALGATGKAQVCPFLITGNSTVTAQFRGTCTFYAGTNDCTVSSDNVYTAGYQGAGFAGIQVDSGSTLIIDDAPGKLTVYGAHQMATPDANGNVPGFDTLYSDALRANTDIQDAEGNLVYDDPWDSAYKVPDGATVDSRSGGAGIGGGAALGTSSSSSTAYAQGTPGTIIIKNGNIEAFGGHQAAGIGGGVNSAATTDKIQIDGGNIIAHGGRWAAGIGDGDSSSAATSTQFTQANSYIEINGGTVTAYGGIAAPGIGSSDEISDIRPMEIAINGGTISAFSGFPDGFAGSYPTDAPAAIGAGSRTNLAENSIYVSSAATLSNASFSQYAITENGKNAATVPTINIDSDGYLLLLRTGEYHSSATRTLDLYLPQTLENPDTGEVCTIYTDQANDAHYYISDHGVVYDTSWNELDSSAVPEDITLYIDPATSTKIDSIELAYFFRSIALTLPHPSKYGGIYALAVPTEGLPAGEAKPKTDQFISLTIDAREQGTQSGEIVFPTPHNLDLDTKASAFIDLDVYDKDQYNNAVNGLIGDEYYPNVYAYTVYIDAASNMATLYAKFEDDGVSSYTIQLDNVDKTATDHGDYRDIALEIDMTGVTQKTIRLKKMDSNKISAISYKITLVKKGEYLLQFDDPSKTYDGQPITMVPTGIFMPTEPEIQETYEVVSNAAPESISPQATASYGPYTSTDMFVYYRVGTRYTINVTMNVEAEAVTPQAGDDVAVNYVVKFNVTKNRNSTINTDSFSMGWQVTYNSDGTYNLNGIQQLTSNPGNGVGDWFSTGQEIGYARNNIPIEVVISSEGSVSISCNNTDWEMFSLASSTETADSQTESNRTEIQAQAQAALDAGATSGSFSYETYLVSGSVQPMTATTYTRSSNTNTSTSYSESYSIGGTKTLTVRGEYTIVSTPVLTTLPAADLEHIQYTFTRIKDADGNAVAEVSTTELPYKAGTYRADATLTMESYNAQGSVEFVISKRAVMAVQIENWLLYISSTDLAVYNGVIQTPGEISIANVVAGDDVIMLADAAAGKVYYNTITVGYAMDKISIVEPYLQGADIANYCIQYTNEAALEIRVYGQIAYDMTGAMFLKTETGPWRKYLDTAGGVQVDGSNADYQSPADADASNGAYRSHAQYVMVRTENEGSDSGRYAIDIEYGELSYYYYHSSWNVNTLEYQDNTDSYWTGNDGSNNKITIINYSNYQIQYQISTEIFFLYAPSTQGSTAGISAKVTTDIQGSAQISQDAWIPMDAATPGDHTRQGTAAQMSYYIYISGTPQMSNANDVHIGNVTLTFKPVT